MSGGKFNYACWRAEEFADQVRNELDRAGTTNEYGDIHSPYAPATLAKLKEIADLVSYCAKLMKETEWMYSGDTGEDTFINRVAKIEAEKP